jgi:hypothetical protein
MHRAKIVAPILAIAALASVLLIQHGPRATAQAQANRARGDYTLIAGRLASGGPHVLYVIDSSNNEMVSLKWDQGRQVMAAFGYRSLSADANMQVGR